jgi:hypothetical protein
MLARELIWLHESPRGGCTSIASPQAYDRTMTRAIQNRARVPLADLVNLRIEPEICFGLCAAPEWRAVVQRHHPAWKLPLADSTADNGLHGRLVVGVLAKQPGAPGLAARIAGLPLAGLTLEFA